MKRLLILCVLALPLSVDAQTCDPAKTVQECWEEFVPPAKTTESADQKADQAEKAAATAATGVTNVAAATESSLKDFLALIAASFESATSTENGDTFTFDWNPDVALVSSNLGFKLQGVFAETKLHDDVAAKLAEKADELKKLQESLEFGDDALLSVSLQPRTAGLGRSIGPHRVAFQEMLVSVQGDDDDTAAADFEISKLEEALGIVAETQPLNGDGNGGTVSEDVVNKRIALIEQTARRFNAERERVSDFTKDFATLLNNQPQFYATAAFHARRNVIGPNEWSGKLTYEFASNNLNAFYRSKSTCRAVVATNAQQCANDLKDFAAKKLSRGIDRLALSLEYHRSGRRWIADPANGLDLGFPHLHSYVGSLSFGANTRGFVPQMTDGAAVGDVGEAHIDFTAKYERPEKSDSEAKGLVASLTYTQKLAGGMSMPISLVYSDHASDLLNVDKKFSARFGLMYKMK